MITNITLNGTSAFPGKAVEKITEINVKDTCAGLVGTPALILIVIIVGMNMLMVFWYKILAEKNVEFKVFNKNYKLFYLVYVMNVILSILSFFYIFNAF